MPTKPTTTIRAVLDMLGGADYVEMDSWIREHDLDIPVVASFVTQRGEKYGDEHRGEVFVSCGGDCIVSFSPQPTANSVRWRPLYLVLDDMKHSSWWVRTGDQRDVPPDQRLDLGPCPRKRLRLVQSA